MKEVNIFLSYNATFVHSSRGNGALGYLLLDVLPNTYQTQAGVEFSLPTNYGKTVHVPAGSTGPDTALKDRKSYQSVDSTLRQQLLGRVDPIYYRGLRNRYTGCTHNSV